MEIGSNYVFSLSDETINGLPQIARGAGEENGDGVMGPINPRAMSDTGRRSVGTFTESVGMLAVSVVIITESVGMFAEPVVIIAESVGMFAVSLVIITEAGALLLARGVVAHQGRAWIRAGFVKFVRRPRGAMVLDGARRGGGGVVGLASHTGREGFLMVTACDLRLSLLIALARQEDAFGSMQNMD